MTRPRLFLLTRGVRRIPRLAALLDDYELHGALPADAAPHDRVLLWGKRPSAIRAERRARACGLGVLHVEDGFLRSVGLGPSDPPLSIVADDVGLYLDAEHPSRLEILIPRPLTMQQRARANTLAAAWREGRLSKYNHARDAAPGLWRDSVLVVDQTMGDASILCGGADTSSFTRMLQAALDEHPHRRILLKVHPDVVSGRKRGHFDLSVLRGHARVTVLDRDLHPASLLDQVCAVYAVSSQLGFEALLWGLPVRLFGMPFYGGWGLTQDELPAPARRCPADIEQLIHAVLVEYCRYVDPETGERCQPETVMAWLALQRRMRQRFEPRIAAVGFSGWKRRYVREFFNGSDVHFVHNLRRLPEGHATAGWGSDALALRAAEAQGQSIRVEDGFLRSVGLGAELTRPISWVQDDLGIYYDATRPSRLERILAETRFPDSLVARAAQLRREIRAAGITKYNLTGAADWQRPASVRRVILVPGQVETDASIRYGANGIAGNIALLRAVREARPEAHILYKPHPDVAAGLRAAGRSEGDAGHWCDEIVGRVALPELLEHVDEVHALTSLAGFEALLRDKTVVTYGQPFYAGWGLTEDMSLTGAVRKRRGRLLALDELVAGVLILYPTYVSRITHRYTTPEQALRELKEWRSAATATPAWIRLIARVFRQA
ncbi:beta-3-deoxy-D-manno-oct-2-ulosonic acid transferase [Bordetella genomosp. 13]|uniref:Beta-3-deoxy-D-manno-oct-2-ulosonic acid transferase n=2 Tax=Bordetella genomosp. 13 TaxID=463040 RepID=A0A1W6Z9L5_9BORD|nr:beta-3-deoxy-D-manno-oct-2-ulosonic acid transferase [Bordetella genomosp. 13]